MWIGKTSFCLLIWQSIILMSSALNRTQAIRLCLFCDKRNHGNTPQATHFPRLFLDHREIPWLFQVFQVTGRPGYNLMLLQDIHSKTACTDRQTCDSCYQSLEFTASENPGVSTTVSRSFTPRSSISTVDDSIFTVRSILSAWTSSSSSTSTSLAAFFYNSLRSLWAIDRNAQIDLINLRKRTFQITLLFGHAHTTHNAVKCINVCVNIYDKDLSI